MRMAKIKATPVGRFEHKHRHTIMTLMVFVSGIKTIKTKCNPQCQKRKTSRSLIKVLNATPLVSVFRLSLIAPIVVTLPLLVLLKDDSLHLSVPPPYLTGAHSDFIHTLMHVPSQPTLCSCSNNCAHAYTWSCVFGVSAFPSAALLVLVLERLAFLCKRLKVGKC